MSKSLPTILTIGATGVVMMSLIMKHLAEVKSDRDASPYISSVENRLGAKLIGAVSIDRRIDDGRVQLEVRARVLAGLNKRRLADAAGREVWIGALRAGDALHEVRVVLADDDGGEVQEFDVASPATRR